MLTAIRCPVCGRLWYESELPERPLRVRMKCKSASCRGSRVTVEVRPGGEVVLVDWDLTRPDAVERGALSLMREAARDYPSRA